MIKPEDNPRPLEMTRLVWVALAVVALIGVVKIADQDQRLNTLGSFGSEESVIIRSDEGGHRFPFLGVSVNLPPGWSYLSVTDDAVAEKPSFVHEESGSILRLQRFALKTWPPSDTEVEISELENGNVEWVQIDHRRLGKLKVGQVELTLIALTHGRGKELHSAIDVFCSQIAPI